MKKISQYMKKIAALAFVLFMSLQISVLELYAEDSDTITIQSVDDLLSFAQNCSLDTWSKGKTVELKTDLSLKEASFEPIPTFAGTFNGNGHTISGVSLQDTVSPKGDPEAVGGIVGENYGSINNCSYTGDVNGSSNVGGIAGYNLGILTGCQNEAYINTTSTDPSLHIDSVNINYLYDLTKLSSMDTSIAASDAGGISGYSSGIIESCVNSGIVGYQHIGYNVGGIVGRSCGYVNNCNNTADVYGRKDVGGIIGQMEPYIEMTLSESSISKLKREIDTLSSMLNSTMNSGKDSSDEIRNRLNSMTKYLDSAADALRDIKTTGSIDSSVSGGGFASASTGIGSGSGISGSGTASASTQIQINTSLSQLSSSVSGLTSQMRLLNGDISDVAGELTDDMKSINNQIHKISDMVFEMVDGSSGSSEMTVDTSDKNVDTVTDGKVFRCVNEGGVYADINVGGIAGAMSIEYRLDPEDDVSSEISGTTRRQYELKAIIQKCENAGEITAKRDCVGSICGRGDIGLVIGSEGYGQVTSESGDYVGGITGFLGGTIRNSYVKCTLSGNDYVGGIIGSGITEDLSGSGSLVSGCYAIVEVSDGEQYVGAIAGANAGEFSNNKFVSEELAGINRTSYTGKAEPITYKKLTEVDGIPEEFQKFTVKFIVEDELIEEIAFEYDDTISKEQFPEIPEIEGKFAKWDTEELTNLKFDKKVTAVYGQYVTALESSKERENGRPVFLAEGQFTDQDELLAAAKDSQYEENKTLMNMLKNQDIIEQWYIEIPDDGFDEHALRYLPLSGKAEKQEIYMKADGKWEKIETEKVGSCLVFQVSGNEVEIIVVSSSALWWGMLVLLVLNFVIIGVILYLIRKGKFPSIFKKVALIVGIVLAVLIVAVMAIVTYFRNEIDIYHVLREFESQTELVMSLDVEAELGTEYLETEATVFRTKLAEKRVTCIEQNGTKLYYADGKILLENGRAYQMTESFPDYSEILGELVEFYQAVEIETSGLNDARIYSITIKQEDAKCILEMLVPSVAEQLSETQTLEVDVILKDEKLDKIEFTSSGNLNDSEKTKISVSAVLTMVKPEDGQLEIAQEVQDAITSGEYEVAGELNEDMFRLLSAWMDLKSQDSLDMKWSINADCGPIAIKEEGNQVTSTEQSVQVSEEVMDLAYQVCLNGNYNCIQNDGAYIYTLSLNEEGMESVVQAISPEAQELGLNLKAGSIQVMVKDDTISGIRVVCSGNAKIALVEVPISFGVELGF